MIEEEAQLEWADCASYIRQRKKSNFPLWLHSHTRCMVTLLYRTLQWTLEYYTVTRRT